MKRHIPTTPSPFDPATLAGVSIAFSN